jgi:hypothetical protein
MQHGKMRGTGRTESNRGAAAPGTESSQIARREDGRIGCTTAQARPEPLDPLARTPHDGIMGSQQARPGSEQVEVAAGPGGHAREPAGKTPAERGGVLGEGRAIRHNEVGGSGGGGAACIRGQAREGDVGLMAEARDHRRGACADGADQILVAEREEVLQ